MSAPGAVSLEKVGGLGLGKKGDKFGLGKAMPMHMAVAGQDGVELGASPERTPSNTPGSTPHHGTAAGEGGSGAGEMCGHQVQGAGDLQVKLK